MFVAFTAESSRTLISVVCTISNNTITAGNTTLLHSYYGGDVFSLDVLSENKVFVAYGLGGNSNRSLWAMVCTINDTIISTKTDTQINSSSSTGETIRTVALSENKVIICHKMNGNANIGGIICNIDNTTITHGSDTVLLENATIGRPFKLSDDKILVAVDTYDIICTVSNMTITIESSQSIQYTGASCLLTSNKRIIVMFEKVFSVLIDNVYTGLCKVTSPMQIITGIAQSNGSAGDTIKVIVPDVE